MGLPPPLKNTPVIKKKQALVNIKCPLLRWRISRGGGSCTSRGSSIVVNGLKKNEAKGVDYHTMQTRVNRTAIIFEGK